MNPPVDGLLVYSPLYRTFSYGPDHPLRPTRLYLTHTLMEACGLLNGPAVVQMEPVEGPSVRVGTGSRSELSIGCAMLDLVGPWSGNLANSGEPFPDAFRWGLGFGDNPIFAGVRDWSYLVCGGSLLALAEVAEGRAGVAFHTGGGFHHAHHDKAAGFCYVNDIAVAIARQVE